MRPLGVARPDLLNNLMEREVAPQQEIREFTENGIQAIQARAIRENKTKPEGVVQWSMYPLSLEKFSVPKLSCIDTGEGMNPEDLVRYIGNLAASGREQGPDSNYGLGAKISALHSNRAGVIYETWQDGVGHRARLIRDNEGKAGLSYFKDDIVFIDGEPLVQKIPEEEMPTLIRDAGGFGTMVIFLGEDERKSNTIDVPKNYDGKKDDWVAWTLNHRYFSFPEGISVRTAINHSKNPRKWNDILGLEDFLKRNSKQNGTIRLPGVRVLWHILKHHKAYSSEKSIFDSGAKMGVLYEGELYQYKTESRAQRSMQHSLGIPFNANQIALLFCPDKADISTSRSDLKINNQDLPKEDWFRAFKKNMPKEIKDLIVREDDSSLEESTQFKNLMKFLGPRRRYYGSRSGPRQGGDVLKNSNLNQTQAKTPVVIKASQTTAQAGQLALDSQTESEAATDHKIAPHASPSKGSPLLEKGNRKKARARLVPPDDLVPECAWVKGKDAGMEGVAVRYLAIENKLLLNESFPFVAEIIKHWQERKSEDQKNVVETNVKQLIAVQAIGAIVNIKRLEGTEGWDAEKVTATLADDHALTVMLSNLYYMNKIVPNSLQHISWRED